MAGITTAFNNTKTRLTRFFTGDKYRKVTVRYSIEIWRGPHVAADNKDIQSETEPPKRDNSFFILVHIALAVLFAAVFGLYGMLLIADMEMEKASAELQSARKLLERKVPTSCPTSRESTTPRSIVTLRSSMTVLCDSETDGGGWIVFQRRVSGAVNFTRNFNEYRFGFGNLNDSFWLGLDNLHYLCSNDKSCELRIDMTYPHVKKNVSDRKYHAMYQRFSVGDQASGYLLTLSGHSGNTRDAMFLHNLSRFSTYDRYFPDVVKCKIKNQIHGGFWYYSYIEPNRTVIIFNKPIMISEKGSNRCQSANLNGKWASDKEYGLFWRPLTYNKNIKNMSFAEMKLRVL